MEMSAMIWNMPYKTHHVTTKEHWSPFRLAMFLGGRGPGFIVKPNAFDSM